jgi:uncharacterized protein (UPF0335 family)
MSQRDINFYLRAIRTQNQLKDEANARLAELYSEARDAGLDVPSLKAAIRVLELSPAEAMRERGLVSVYLRALGIKDDDAQSAADEDSWAPIYESEPEHDV